MKRLTFLLAMFLPLMAFGQNISFQDSNVKKICVHYWDTNGDGELSRAEAAAVTDIGTYFKDNSSIKYFNELKFFTGLKTIPGKTFYNCNNLTSVTIPDNVTSIGNEAFWFCKILTTVIIPNTVTSIGSWAFTDCYGLTSVTIPNSVTSIGSNAFYMCKGLTSIDIPNSVTSIGVESFRSCSSLKTVTLGNGVKNIGARAFGNCSSITKVTALMTTPPRITSDCFPNRNNMNLYVPSGCKSAYEKADYWWEFNSITEISPKTEQTLSLASIPSMTYGSNYYTLPTKTSQGQTLTWNSSNTAVAAVSGNLLYVKGAGSATITASQAGNDSYLPFSKAYTVTVSKAPLTISADNCEKRQGEANPALTVSYSGFVNGDDANSLTKKPTVTTTATTNSAVGTYPIIPSGAESPNYSFTYKNGVLTITEPVNPNAVGDTIVYAGLKYKVTQTSDNANNKVTLIKNPTAAGEINIPATISDGSGRFKYAVTAIEDNAFFNCDKLSKLYIPASVTSIGKRVTSCCTILTEIVVDPGNAYYDSRNNCNAIIEKSTMTLLAGCNTTVIPEGVTAIGAEAMRGMYDLKELRLPSSLTTIGSMAFYYCTGITGDLVIPEGVTSIGTYTFHHCIGLTSVSIPSTIQSLGSYVFRECKNVRLVRCGIATPPSIASTMFGNYADCVLMVPEGSVNAYKSAPVWKTFKSIVADNLVDFADENVKAICVSHWDTNGDGELSKTEAAAVTSIGEEFKSNKSITTFDELRFFTSLKAIGANAFDGCFELMSVTLPEGLASIGDNAFFNCSKLSRLYVPASVTSIGKRVTSCCTILTEIVVDPNNAYYDSRDNCNAIIEKSTMTLLAGCNTTVIPEGVTAIGAEAMRGMYDLKELRLPSSLTTIGSMAFYYCTSLTGDLVIPEGVTSIGTFTFHHCIGLTSVSIPSTIQSMGYHVFRECSNVKLVRCAIATPPSITSTMFGNYADCVLMVPQGSVDAYKSAPVWKTFKSVVGFEEGNTLSANGLALNLGGSGELTVSLSNNIGVDGVQFDVTLPEGLSFATDEDGEPMAETTARVKRMTASCVSLGGNSYRIVLFSTNRSIIEPGEGAILKLTVECPKTTIPGDYKTAFSEIYLSCAYEEYSFSVAAEGFETPVTVSDASTIVGDANGDFEINIADVMFIVDHILNRYNGDFIFANADIDGDGRVDVSDAMNVVNIILHKSSAGMPANAIETGSDLLRMDGTATGCTLHTTAFSPTLTAMEMTVELPEGCRLAGAKPAGKAAHTHQVMAHSLGGNRYKVVVFSMDRATVDAGEDFLDLSLEGRGGWIAVKDILCTDTDLETLVSSDLNAVVTGIGGVFAGDKADSLPVYNVSGQRMAKPRKGVNISNGRKVVVK